MVARNILIVGGGIAGLTLATALSRRGQAVEIVEQAPAWAPVGTGIMLHANAVAVLTSLGLGPGLAARGRRMTAMRVTDRAGRVLTHMDLGALEAQFGPSYAFHRAELHELLLTAARPANIHLGETITALRPDDDGVAVSFASGRAGRFDLVVGADGLHSQVRRLALPAAAAPVYSGYTCWRFVAGGWSGPAAPVEMWGRGARVGVVPLTGDRVYVYLTQNAPAGQSDPATDRHEWLRAQFTDFGEPAGAALARLTPATTLLRHDLLELPALRWGAGRIFLVGDAAHAMTPNLGQGAAQAIEGALALAVALTTAPDLAAAHQQYRQRHQRRVAAVQARSRQVGRMGQWSNELACRARDLAARLLPAAANQANIRRLVAPGVTLAQTAGGRW